MLADLIERDNEWPLTSGLIYLFLPITKGLNGFDSRPHRHVTGIEFGVNFTGNKMADLSKLSLQELRELSNRVRVRIQEAEKDELASARRQIEEIARRVGLPIDELLTSKKKEKQKLPVRFQHPDDSSKQWTGRGRQPRWVREWLAGGAGMDKLRVNS